MAFINYNNKEITIKIVYYGPALSGKTTCLRYIYQSKEFEKKGKLITLDTDGDRTLFFDFLPVEVGKLGGYTVKMQLYTVPGQVAYDTTRKLVLQGADGVVFVADSQIIMEEQNYESYENLKENLQSNDIPFEEIPIVFNYNKRDLKDVLTIDRLNEVLNTENKPFFPTIATNGENIQEGLHAIMKMVIIYLKNKLSIFQKDKTVMFSRDEITTASKKDTEAKTEQKPIEEISVPSKYNEDDIEVTPAPEILPDEKSHDEIFELDGAVSDFTDEKEVSSDSEDEIFDLDDGNVLENEESSDEDTGEHNAQDINEQVMTDTGKEQIADLPNHEKTDMAVLEDEKDNPDVIVLESEKPNGLEDVQIPINITVPKDKNEVIINLNMKIIIKRR
jgi:small GTP-binding protein